MKLSPLFLLLTFFGNANASEGTCACEAEELGFTIDCANTAQMSEALTTLALSGCASDCSSELCEKSWYIVQSHHDYCPIEGLPEELEDDFHNYDEVCTQCEIRRAVVEGAPDCPTANCEDGSGTTAYESLITTGCNIDCSSEECKSLFHVLLVTHDSCPHDSLSPAAELGYHDVERACVEAVCNDVSGVLADPLICVEHDDHDDHGDEDHDDHGDEDHDDHGDEHDSHDDHDDEHESHDESAGVAVAFTSTATALMGAAILLA